MSQGDAYDLTEATEILDHGRAVFKVDEERQRAAVHKLIEEVEKLAAARGYDTEKRAGEGTLIYCNKMGVRILEERCFPVIACGWSRGGEKLQLAFDPESGIFVGTAWDEFYVGIPGEPRKRMSAVAVMCQRIVFEIARQLANIERDKR